MNLGRINLQTSILFTTMLIALLSSCTRGQNTSIQHEKIEFSDYTKRFVSIDSSHIALVGAKLIDGTGSPSKTSQTVLIKNGKIEKIGLSQDIKVPTGYVKLNLKGKTLIPGIIGMHNHMRIPQSAMLSTSPRAYLGSGVTTIQTCGTGNPYEELAIAKSINKGEQPGPEIINSGPYFTGPEGKSHFIRNTDASKTRDTIQYWAKKGVKWLKVYRNTRPQDLKIIVQEAHKNGLKVTGHLCATTFAKASEIGIDAIEHGFLHCYDFAKDNVLDTCSGSTDFRVTMDINGEDVRTIHKKLIDNGVALGSTLAIFEALYNAKADKRDLAVMSPRLKEAYDHRRKRKKELGDAWPFKKEWLKQSMDFELLFYKRGGLLVAGLDPGVHNMPGFGDQKNYELFIKAGFKPEEAIKIISFNGARLLGRNDIGSIEIGKTANLVVLNGNLETNPAIIREIDLVFKNGIGYNAGKLITSIHGNIGSVTDNNMTYFGQKEPTSKPELFAPDIISKPDRHEFGCTLSKNGRELYFGVDNNGLMEIHYTRLINGVWTKQEKLFDSDSISYNDPMLSQDDKRLYFISNRPKDASHRINDIDIWYIERANRQAPWSKPINLGTPINTDKNEYYTSFTTDGTLYFSSQDQSKNAPKYAYDIYRSKFINGRFLTPEKLPKSINTSRYEADVFIAPDESYIIFCSIRKNGLGRGDLYISFRDKHDKWSNAVNMKSLNTDKHELCPYVSADGKYLFYTSNQDIYWVSTKVLEEYRP